MRIASKTKAIAFLPAYASDTLSRSDNVEKAVRQRDHLRYCTWGKSEYHNVYVYGVLSVPLERYACAPN
jgi:hypothetical protein